MNIRANYFYLLSLFFFILLSGCATVPRDVEISSYEHAPRKIIVPSRCVENRDVRNNLAKNQLNPSHIGVLNWNIYKEQLYNWDEDLGDLMQDTDVVMLQEASLNYDLLDFLRNKDRVWTINNAFLLKCNQTGVLTASKIKPLLSCGLREKEPIIQLPKTALISYYGIKNNKNSLLVINLHSVNFTLSTGSYKKQLDSIENIIFNHRGPVILAGDFNTWSDKRMELVEELAARVKLKEAKLTPDNRIIKFGKYLDHLYYKNLKLIKGKTYQVTSSDHNPIKAIFAS